jgi:iron complex transport system permease protein
MTLEVATERRPALLRGGWTKGGGLLVAVALLVVVTFVSLAFGAKPISLRTVWEALLVDEPVQQDHLVVRSLRVPRTAIGLLVGVSLGLAGGVMQGLTRNPLADPGILGVGSGAALGVVLGIYTFGVSSFNGYVWFAFAGAAVASVVVYVLGSVGRGGATPAKLALAGAALSALLGSLTSAILLIDVATLDQFRFWVVGSLSGRSADVGWSLLWFALAGSVMAIGSARALNTMALGDDVARSLGLPLPIARGAMAIAVILLAGAATAAAGPIVFVGLTVPHVARAICGPNYWWILSWSAVLAPALLLGADVVGRVIARPGEVQVGIVTAIIGAPFFVALVRRRSLAAL